MLTLVSRKWWALVLRGSLAVLLGILAFVWPTHTLNAIFILVGIFLIIDGIISAGSSLSHRRQVGTWWIFFAEGLFGLLVGLFALLWPQVAAVALVIIIGVWAVITGILEILGGIGLRATLKGEWLLILGGVLSVVFGLLLILIPSSAVIALMWLIAAYFILFGIVLIALGFRTRPYRDSPGIEDDAVHW